jgi:hypothetical protein
MSRKLYENSEIKIHEHTFGSVYPEMCVYLNGSNDPFIIKCGSTLDIDESVMTHLSEESRIKITEFLNKYK